MPLISSLLVGLVGTQERIALKVSATASQCGISAMIVVKQ